MRTKMEIRNHYMFLLGQLCLAMAIKVPDKEACPTAPVFEIY